MKIHAYLRTNVPKLLSNEKIPKVTNLIYFLVAPTLLYCEDYPKTKRIRWVQVGKLLVEFCALWHWMSVLTEELHYTFRDFGKAPETWESLLRLFVKSWFLGGTYCLTYFYYSFHIWLNIFAEVLRYPDKEFYKVRYFQTSKNISLQKKYIIWDFRIGGILAQFPINGGSGT